MREAKIQITGFVQQTNLLLQNTRHAIHEAFRDFKAINLKIKCIHERIAADSEFVPNEKRAKRFQQPDESMMTREERPGVTITQKSPFSIPRNCSELSRMILATLTLFQWKKY